MALRYPSIPEPTLAPESMRDAILSIKQMLEILTGQRGNPGYAAITIDNAQLTGAITGLYSGIADNTADIALKADMLNPQLSGNTHWSYDVPTGGAGGYYDSASVPNRFWAGAAGETWAVYNETTSMLSFDGATRDATFSGKVLVGPALVGEVGDIGAARAGAPATGAYYFGSTAGKVLYYDGANYVFYGGSIHPSANATYNLGSASYRWNIVYTSDLSLKNDHGDWTIVEGEDDLFLYNNKRGKTYKFTLTEVDPATVPPKKV